MKQGSFEVYASRFEFTLGANFLFAILQEGNVYTIHEFDMFNG